MTLALLALLIVYVVAAAGVIHWFRLGRGRCGRVLIATVASSGTAGVWAWLVMSFLTRGSPLELGGVATTGLLFFFLSLGPNLFGLALVGAALSRARVSSHWRHPLLSIPVGAVYGVAVAAASPMGLLVLSLGRPWGLVELMSFPPVIVAALASGVVALGLLALLEARASR